jgi:phytoene synthase
VRRFHLRREDFHAVIDGMAMDLEADIRAPDWATLDLYCDRVASAVGRLSVRIFGMPPESGDALAHHLGRALQLTNILRDLDEDAEMGRLYLPREALAAAGIAVEGRTPATILADPRLEAACREVAARATGHFDAADRIMSASPRRAVRAPRTMEAAYRRILKDLLARGFAPPRTRVRTRKLHVLGAVLRHGLA